VSNAGCPACVPRRGQRRRWRRLDRPVHAPSASLAGMIGRQGLWQEQAFPFPRGGRRNHVKSRAGWLCPAPVRPCLARLRGGQPMLVQIPRPDPSSELHAVSTGLSWVWCEVWWQQSRGWQCWCLFRVGFGACLLLSSPECVHWLSLFVNHRRGACTVATIAAVNRARC
jgi:hypothetical protein